MTALGDQAIGVVVSRRVPMANAEAFETALGELKQIASRQPGQIACDLILLLCRAATSVRRTGDRGSAGSK